MKKLVVVLLDVDTNEVLERWEFNIEIEDDAKEAAKENIGGNNTEKKDAKAGSVREISFWVDPGISKIFEHLWLVDRSIYTGEEAGEGLGQDQAGDPGRR